MKKIVALVLSLVMVMGLATTAFGAITLWDTANGSTAKCDVYSGDKNVKIADDVAVTYTVGQELKLNKDGTVKQAGVLPHFTMKVNLGNGFATDYKFVQVYSIPATADASEYVLVKAHDATVKVGATMLNQSATDAYYILKQADAVTYYATATLFTAWSDDCDAYAEPLDAEDVAYYSVSNKTDLVTSLTVKYPAVEDVADGDFAALSGQQEAVLVDGEVIMVAVNAKYTAPITAHTWQATKWNVKNIPTEFTCTNCKVVGTVVNSPLNSPAGNKLTNLNGILISYSTVPAVEAPAAGDKVESAQTFDAGIAMYVGMSVMAAAGSAVVLKKKD